MIEFVTHVNAVADGGSTDGSSDLQDFVGSDSVENANDYEGGEDVLK